MRKPTLCVVTWRDILSCSGWEKESEVECPTIKQVGWLVSKNKDTIKIASTLDPNDSINGAKVGAFSFMVLLLFLPAAFYLLNVLMKGHPVLIRKDLRPCSS